jgi:CheY-like chemotaxis protein
MFRPHIALLVDDDKLIHHLILHMTRDLPLEWRWARTLEQARDMLEGCDPRVMLLDLSLPDGDGLDFLRSEPHLPPTLLLTGYSSEQIILPACASLYGVLYKHRLRGELVRKTIERFLPPGGRNNLLGRRDASAP